MVQNMKEFPNDSNNKVPSDCLICAAKPALYLNRVNLCSADFYCYHTNPPANPQLRVSRLYQSINLFSVFLLCLGIVNDFSHVDAISPKYIIVLIEMFFSFSSILINFLCLKDTNRLIRQYHGLIAIVNNRLAFGMRTILSSKIATIINRILLFCILLVVLEEALTFCTTVANDVIDLNLSARVVMIEINIITNVSLGIGLIHYLGMYEALFRKCFQEIESCFSDIRREDSVSMLKMQLSDATTRLEKFKRVQRLYMSIRRNFKLLEDCISFGIHIYIIIISVLLIAYGYFVVMVMKHEASFPKFDYFITGKSLAVVLGFTAFCAQMQRLFNSVDDVLSFLFKFPVSKLSAEESLQIEMMIATLALQKPSMSASNMLTVGTGLIASITGTAVTYVLVALQFQAKAMKK